MEGLKIPEHNESLEKEKKALVAFIKISDEMLDEIQSQNLSSEERIEQYKSIHFIMNLVKENFDIYKFGNDLGFRFGAIMFCAKILPNSIKKFDSLAIQVRGMVSENDRAKA